MLDFFIATVVWRWTTFDDVEVVGVLMVISRSFQVRGKRRTCTKHTPRFSIDTNNVCLEDVSSFKDKLMLGINLFFFGGMVGLKIFLPWCENWNLIGKTLELHNGLWTPRIYIWMHVLYIYIYYICIKKYIPRAQPWPLVLKVNSPKEGWNSN